MTPFIAWELSLNFSSFKVIPVAPHCSAEVYIFHPVYAWLVTAKRAVSNWVLEGLACASKHRHILIRVQQTTRLIEQYCVEVTQRNSRSQRQLLPPSAGIAMYLCSSVHLPPLLLIGYRTAVLEDQASLSCLVLSCLLLLPILCRAAFYCRIIAH